MILRLQELLEQNLKNLTKQFINNFINEYRKVDENATDSYVINQILPDVFSSSMSLDFDNQFYYPLVSDGLVSNLVKAEYNKNIKDLYPTIKDVFQQKSVKNIDIERYRFLFVSEDEYKFDKFEHVNGKCVIVNKSAKVELYKIISTTNTFEVCVSVFYDEDSKELRKVTLSSEKKSITANLPYCEIRVKPIYVNDVLQHELSSIVMGYGDDNILDINAFWTAIQIINQYITDGEE